MIKQALLSVSNKTGLTELAAFLADSGVNLISTGGTAKLLLNSGLKVTEAAVYTGSPELLDGRVKTLHPKIHAGLLFRRDNPLHCSEMEALGWLPIDMVVVNLYPFEEVTARPETTFEQAIENIDIGGPSLLRAAAKNHKHVAVLSDPGDYPEIIKELKSAGKLSPLTLKKLAFKAFLKTSKYDTAISNYLNDRL